MDNLSSINRTLSVGLKKHVDKVYISQENDVINKNKHFQSSALSWSPLKKSGQNNIQNKSN